MMFDLFKWMARPSAFDAAGLGTDAIARPIAADCALPPGTIGVVVSASGHTRRVSAGGRLTLAANETAWCFHPGPYGCDLVPFAAAPEIGLRVHFAVDSPDPRMHQQRFDLFLASEAVGELVLGDLAARIEAALQRELAQGNLELPPCTTLDEWNAFRGGFNQLLYTRFGVTVDDCVPVDLSGTRDFAGVLAARAVADAPAVPPAPTPLQAVALPPAATPLDDAHALRRLFLELPCVMCRVRQAALPQGQDLFRQQQALIQRLDLVCLAASTMPALGLAAPGQPLAPAVQQQRASYSLRAAAALDEAWALLARIERAEDEGLGTLLDEADRIVANLEEALAARKQVAFDAEAA
ncbi:MULTISPECIES: hypothetical protein [unclassified Massilia]|uniref:hypothetical protein n=1 Tax=unclassified Massilia TaxID=2609279 RepID=UPI001786F954|nr:MULTISPECIES: hypothetical protein [unclassified Massilia]MBD8532343.1 hypothetical protein [Massilia sp. CFBP 13647]MBD8673784.1 hypothetical protein [Massilia sp. CFBP 13721]